MIGIAAEQLILAW